MSRNLVAFPPMSSFLRTLSMLLKVADKVAAAGFFVAVPDFLKGDPFIRADTKRPMSVWIKDHSTDEGFEFSKVVIQDLKNRGYSAIGAAGFCWGAKAAIQLAKCNSIKAAALLHQSYVTVDEIKAHIIIKLCKIDSGMRFRSLPGLVNQTQRDIIECENFVFWTSAQRMMN
ncbi:endo-1,3;1,4-beta-D-glucanase-like [Humulus lupulus]|uniref:endo-1,3;1,4-beta-D-glucanase-like n=1 Tax=Humulus lupulus TaxID=3486 RepID=UPI002B404FDF|nr:endo-1,3;1,4-beta-D-glucanase-like [Humulus lupulus]